MLWFRLAQNLSKKPQMFLHADVEYSADLLIRRLTLNFPIMNRILLRYQEHVLAQGEMNRNMLTVRNQSIPLQVSHQTV